jgi:hypothetical protein
MKIQGNMTPQKVNNHTTKDMNDSEVDDISNIELKRMMTRMISEIKDCMYVTLMKTQSTNK